jgi:hypothetical protein
MVQHLGARLICRHSLCGNSLRSAPEDASQHSSLPCPDISLLKGFRCVKFHLETGDAYRYSLSCQLCVLFIRLVPASFCGSIPSCPPCGTFPKRSACSIEILLSTARKSLFSNPELGAIPRPMRSFSCFPRIYCCWIPPAGPSGLRAAQHVYRCIFNTHDVFASGSRRVRDRPRFVRSLSLGRRNHPLPFFFRVLSQHALPERCGIYLPPRLGRTGTPGSLRL